MIPDLPYSERNLTKNIPKKPRGTFSHGRNIVVQGVPENTDPDHKNFDIREWKFIKQFLMLKSKSTQQVVRLAKKDRDSRPRLMKISFPHSHMAAETLKVFSAE